MHPRTQRLVYLFTKTYFAACPLEFRIARFWVSRNISLLSRALKVQLRPFSGSCPTLFSITNPNRFATDYAADSSSTSTWLSSGAARTS